MYSDPKIVAEIELAWSQQYRQPYQTESERRRLRLHRLGERQNWRCCYCGDRMSSIRSAPGCASIERILPRSLGGTDDEDNLALACIGCNTDRKSAMRPEHYEALRLLRQSQADLIRQGTLHLKGATQGSPT